MAHVATVSRLTASALSSVRFGASKAARIPLLGNATLSNSHEDLHKSFRKLTLSPLEAKLTADWLCNSNQSVLSPLESKEYRLPSLVKPLSISVPSAYNGLILEKDLPPLPNLTELIDPIKINNEVREDPSKPIVEKQAIRLIVIRRKRMKKHKLRKLRKKMIFPWRKIRQRREYKKEKLFQAEQMAIVREAQAFDAAKYVEDVLRRSKESKPQVFWKGKKKPEFVVLDLKAKHKLKMKKKAEHQVAIEEMRQEIERKGLGKIK